jgi:hypothetical protein
MNNAEERFNEVCNRASPIKYWIKQHDSALKSKGLLDEYNTHARALKTAKSRVIEIISNEKQNRAAAADPVNYHDPDYKENLINAVDDYQGALVRILDIAQGVHKAYDPPPSYEG